MSLLSVRLSDRETQILENLYKKANIQTDNISLAFRELLNFLNSEILDSQQQLERTASTLVETESCKIPTSIQQLESLEGWDCSFRAVVFKYSKFTKKQEPKIHCSAMNTRRILGTNIIDISVCKKCHLRGSSSPFIAIPEAKKTDKPKPTQKQTVKNRYCVDCGTNISTLEEWKTRCLSCYKKAVNPDYRGPDKPMRGSPMDLRQREARKKRESIRLLKDAEDSDNSDPTT